jgi:hypothetical protein
MKGNVAVFLIAAAVAVGLVWQMEQLSPGSADQLDKAIKLASTVLGFAMTVFGAVKSILGVSKVFGATTEEVLPAGVTVAIGILLVLASRVGG